MKRKISLIMLYCFVLSSSLMAESGLQKGIYAGVSVGGSSLGGERSDRHISAGPPPRAFQLSQNKSIKDTSERGEVFLGYFYPFLQQGIGVSCEGFYGFSRLRDTIRSDLGLLAPAAGVFIQESLEVSRSFGGNVRVGPIIQQNHFLAAIVGFETARFSRYHEDGVGREFHRVSKFITGFQYGISYQYGWDKSTIGIELKQTRFPATKIEKISPTNALTTTNFKANVSSLLVRYTYRF
jgi:hypothetical protein